MTIRKSILAIVALLVAACGAFAGAVNWQAFQVYYSVGIIGTSTEDCIPFETLRGCRPGEPTCIEFTPDGMKNLYDERDPIGETSRFSCQVPLED